MEILYRSVWSGIDRWFTSIAGFGFYQRKKAASQLESFFSAHLIL